MFSLNIIPFLYLNTFSHECDDSPVIGQKSPIPQGIGLLELDI